jgi:hypothetical protein
MSAASVASSAHSVLSFQLAGFGLSAKGAARAPRSQFFVNSDLSPSLPLTPNPFCSLFP